MIHCYWYSAPKIKMNPPRYGMGLLAWTLGRTLANSAYPISPNNDEWHVGTKRQKNNAYVHSSSLSLALIIARAIRLLKHGDLKLWRGSQLVTCLSLAYFAENNDPQSCVTLMTSSGYLGVIVIMSGIDEAPNSEESFDTFHTNGEIVLWDNLLVMTSSIYRLISFPLSPSSYPGMVAVRSWAYFIRLIAPLIFYEITYIFTSTT